MPWTSPQPLERWSDRQQALWDNEIWTRVKFFTMTFAPGSIPASTIATFSVASTGSPDVLTNACQGLRVGMGLKLTAPAVPPGGLMWDCTVTADDTLTIWIQNLSGAAATPPAGTWAVTGVLS